MKYRAVCKKENNNMCGCGAVAIRAVANGAYAAV